MEQRIRSAVGSPRKLKDLREKNESTAHLLDAGPPFLPFLSGDQKTVLGIEEDDEVRRPRDGDRVVEVGEGERANGVGDEEDVRGPVEMVGIRGRCEIGGAKESELEDLFDDFDGGGL